MLVNIRPGLKLLAMVNTLAYNTSILIISASYFHPSLIFLNMVRSLPLEEVIQVVPLGYPQVMFAKFRFVGKLLAVINTLAYNMAALIITANDFHPRLLLANID